MSSCLLGEEVRYDGGHKHDRFVTDVLGRYFDYVAFCPEMAIGLGAPRAPLRLVGDTTRVRVRGVRDPQLDVTDALVDYADSVRAACARLGGYIFKRGSPSCGVQRVSVYTEAGMPSTKSSGAFAGRLMETLPLLPVEEEGRLRDPVLRENFVTRVYVYDRWQRALADGLDAGALVTFHTRHKFLLLAHCEQTYRRLGRLVAGAGARPIDELAAEYVAGLMSALAKRASRGRHGNVLHHVMGYLKREIDAGDRRELVDVIDAYRRGRVPLVVPLTLLKHHFRRSPDPYVSLQYYLEPYPESLMLRNDI
ncbi:MAG: DUF523 and DUF1722 domain-containing protein [Gammaproteobacteria bacterium]|nr:DUF523 and DUF1722 domain-containing protein [Gammaproteobacteria bacterium]